MRVVRVIGAQTDSHTYGLAFVHADTNIWGIEFPPLTQSEKEAVYSLFECTSCNGRKMVYRGDYDDGMGKKSIVQACKRCGSATTWRRVLNNEVGTGAIEEPRVLAPQGAEVDVR